MKFNKGDIRIVKYGIAPSETGAPGIKAWTSLLVLEHQKIPTPGHGVYIDGYLVEIMGTPFTYLIDERILEHSCVLPGEML